jgi:drug/metabolite transporter (DMT)-like permease
MVGFLIVLLASFFFCFQNVIVRILFNEQNLFGLFQVGGYLDPTLENSFLLMFMRMVLVVPLMASLAGKLYPRTWQEIRQLGQRESRPLLLRSLVGGGLMFLYLALLYLSIGLIETGIAMTLFFTYPVFTALLSWQFFGTPPTRFRWLVMGLVLSGSILTIPHSQNSAESYSAIGVILGIGAGITYAFYTVNAQKTFESSVHPVPFTWISFATTLVLSATSLLIWQNPSNHLNWTPLWIGGLCSAIVTFAGHLMNNFGIRLIGATTAATIGASNPALTVILAWLTIQETLNGLQLLGAIIVTLSVVLISQENR